MGETALLVMDFQVGIVPRVSNADALLDRVAHAIATARHHGVTVGYVRVAFTEADVAAIPSTNKSFSVLAQSGSMATMLDTAPETQVHERLAPQPGDIVVRKTRVGPFSTTDLDPQLRERGITTLALAGISTSGVVLSTVREAADNDYALVVLADGVADTDDEVHRVLVEKVFPRQADVITIADLDARLDR